MPSPSAKPVRDCFADHKHAISLPVNWYECERGNVLLADDGGGMVAWLKIADTPTGTTRLEVGWQPDNYPALNVQVVTLSDAELAAHINKNCQGWCVRKCNVAGVDTDLDRGEACPRVRETE